MATKIKNNIKYFGLLLLTLLFFVLSTKPCLGLPSHRLISVHHTLADNAEFVKLLLSHKSEYKILNLKHPSCFVIYIENCYFQSLHSIITVNSELISRIKISQFTRDRVRVVIDKKREVKKINIKSLSLSDAFNIQIGINSEEKILPDEIQSSFVELTDVSKEIKIQVPAHPEIKQSVEQNDQNLDDLFSLPEGDITIDEAIEKTSSDNKHSKLLISGDLRNETAYRLKKPHYFSKIKNIANIKASGELSNNVSYLIGSRFSYDMVFYLTDNYNQNVENDQKSAVNLRDAYLDLNLGNFDLRLGNQQIVWGQAVGLFFADIVNPKDLREYILPDLDQIRIPVPAVNMEYYYDNFYFQCIFIPFPKFNEVGEKGSEYDFSKPLFNQNAEVFFSDPSNPPNSLDNSEVGGRVSWFKDGWDISLFYLYDMYNFPVNYRHLETNPTGSAHPVTIYYDPEYERIHRFGSTFSKEIMDIIFKGEFIFNQEMYFETADSSDLDGIMKSPSFDWLLGLDYSFWGVLDTNFQIMQNIILDDDPGIIQRKYETYFSIWLKAAFFEDLIEPECFFVSSINRTDWLFSPQITYNHSDVLKFIIGADIFRGEMDGGFGIFDGNDRIYLEILVSI